MRIASVGVCSNESGIDSSRIRISSSYPAAPPLGLPYALARRSAGALRSRGSLAPSLAAQVSFYRLAEPRQAKTIRLPACGESSYKSGERALSPPAIAIVAALLAATPAAAQNLVPEAHPYGLDPYNPSDAAVLRTYGSTLVAQTPILQLRELDPYKPSHAALLRQLGGAMPIWSHLSWYPMAAPLAPLMEVPAPAVAAGKPQSPNVVVIVIQPGERFVAPPSPRQPRRQAVREQWVLSGNAQSGVVWTRSPQSEEENRDGADEPEDRPRDGRAPIN